MDTPIYFYTRSDPYFELSNFYPQGFEEEGAYWPSVEHYFQAQKFSDPDYRELIRLASTAKQAKTLGRTRTVRLRADWEEVKDDIMRHALLEKFQHTDLKELLLGTDGRLLIENSPFDSYWGCGPDGDGKNRLGVLLMEVREELRQQSNPKSE